MEYIISKNAQIITNHYIFIDIPTASVYHKHLFLQLNKIILQNIKNIFLLLVFLLPLFGYSQKVELIKFKQLESKYSNNSDTVYLLNYWATWCKPCVEELPDFIKINKELKDKPFKMILVSLDFPRQIETRVIPFIQENKIKAEVVVLDDDANVWINKVNKDWDGDIPVTQVIHKHKKEFYNTSLNYKELKDIIHSKLKLYEKN